MLKKLLAYVMLISTLLALTVTGVCAESDAEFLKGDEITVVFMIGGVTLEGENTKIAAYNYTLTYDASKIEYVPEDMDAQDKTDGGQLIINAQNDGIIKAAAMAAAGFNNDFSGDKIPALAIKFTVLEDTADLGITGECTSLTALTPDGSSTVGIVDKKSLEDVYTATVLEVKGSDGTVRTVSVAKPEKAPAESSQPAESIAEPKESSTTAVVTIVAVVFVLMVVVAVVLITPVSKF